MKKASKIFSNLFLIIAIAILVICIYFYAQAKKTNSEVFIFGFKPYIIQTGSMEPTLKVKSLIIVKKVDFNDIKENDMISFKAEGFNKNVCHRVVRIENDSFITKGDNNNHEDTGSVTKEAFVGKVIFHANITAYIANLFSTTTGKIIIALILIAIIAVIVGIKIFIKNRKE